MLLKSTLREIRSSFGRFAAIFAIIALGVGFFNGLKVTERAMHETIDRYVRKNSMFDYQIISTLGLTAEDIEAFSALDGVSKAEGTFSTDVIVSPDGRSEFVLKAHMISGDINTPELIAGSLPENDAQCIADAAIFSENDIGKAIIIAESSGEDITECFKYKSYTITGIGRSVLYINHERGSTSLGTGTLSGFIFIPEGGFNTDFYTEAYITLGETGYVYSAEYDGAIEKYRASVEELAELRAEMRYEDIISEAEEKIAEGETELSSGFAEYFEARETANAEFASAFEELDSVRAELNLGWNEYHTASEEFDSKKAEIISKMKDAGMEITDDDDLLELMQTDYSAQLAEVQAGRTIVDEKTAEYNANLQSFNEQTAIYEAELKEYEELYSANSGSEDPEVQQQLIKMQEKLEAAKAALAAAETELAEGKLLLEANVREIEAAEEAVALYGQQITEFQAAQTALDKAYDDLVYGESQYDAGLTQYIEEKENVEAELAEAFDELTEAEAELVDARTELSDIEFPDVYVLDRYDNIGFACFENDSKIVENIAYVFPVFFFLVAALVCITTMTRMVDEHRTEMGTLKALGYGNLYIMSKFLIYSGSASLFGCIAGYFGGSYIIPKVLWQAYNMMYGFSGIVNVFDWTTGILSVAAFMACAFYATWSASRKELSSVPAEMIRPKAPKAGKRIFLERIPFVWNRLSFLYKVSLRNMFRYKKRMFMMIIGISGCTAMLLAGFGIDDSISRVVDYQYSEITLSDGTIMFSKDISQTDGDIIAKSCELTEGLAVIGESSADVAFKDKVKTVTLVSAESGSLDGYMDFHIGEEKVEFPDMGEAIINGRVARDIGVETGDTVTVRGSDMKTHELTISGVFDNYIYDYMYISCETAESIGLSTEMKSALVDFVDGADHHEAAAEIMSLAEVLSCSVNQDSIDRLNNMLSSMNYIVVLVIVCAGALAFIVIYNLTNISITERIREIATIKVLGFYPFETESYVFRENLIMTGLGAVFGLGLGVLLHRFIMQQIKVDLITFESRIEPTSYLYAVVLTFVFALIVALFMFFKLQKINMAESLKSIE